MSVLEDGIKPFTRPPLGPVSLKGSPNPLIFERDGLTLTPYPQPDESPSAYGQLERYHGSDGEDYYNLGDLLELFSHIEDPGTKLITLDQLKVWATTLIKEFEAQPINH
ncbi:MAG: hypothetical protein LBS60_05445 [Deltaproteobacteria bacterium]|jgi:hypothetical protein|nr:hypothetical protein [Deltaproteobacteria bacterium]